MVAGLTVKVAADAAALAVGQAQKKQRAMSNSKGRPKITEESSLNSPEVATVPLLAHCRSCMVYLPPLEEIAGEVLGPWG